jgi:site-specific DNA-methyltransferase (adenine-specific)
MKAEIGNATLYLGDCLEVLPSLPAIDAVISDPPYGMEWDGRVTPGKNGHAGGKSVHYGETIEGDAEPFDPSPWLSFERVLLWGCHHYAYALPKGTILVWIKRLDNAFGTFLSDADLAWMKGGHGVYCKRGPFPQSMASDRLHPTQKPVQLMEWCIEKAKVPKGGLILDPYMGSGSTGIAALNMGYRFIGIEKDAKHFQVACDRIDGAQAQGQLFA